MTRNKKIFITIIVVIVVLFVWVLIRGPEDTWICVDGEWVKHGVPSAPMPTKPCGESKENPCAVCINSCDTCPEGCEECLIGIEKKLKDPNMKWYYNHEIR